MYNYIATTDGQFINLAGIVLIEDVGTDDEPLARLTTIAGFEVDVKGEDAEALFDCLELLALETQFARQKLQAMVDGTQADAVEEVQ